MGTIKIKDSASIIGSYDDEDEEIRFCEICSEHGFYHVLRERLYPPDPITKKPVTVPRDHDEWLQCRTCGTVSPRYQTKVEDKITGFADTTDNPFDSGKKVTGLDNKVRQLSPTQKDRRKQKERIEAEKEPDIRKELRKGNAVEKIEYDDY